MWIYLRSYREHVITSLLLLVSLSMVSSAAEHQVNRGSGASSHKKGVVSSRSMNTEQVTNIPYFTLRNGMHSTLTLNNLADEPTTANVTIFNSHGRAQVLAPIVVGRHTYKQLRLQDILTAEDFDSGNIEISYTGMPMGLTCQVSVFSLEKQVSFEAREQDMMDFMSSKLNGIVWLPHANAKGFLAVTNTAPDEVSVSVQSKSEARKETLTLASRETRLLEINDELHVQGPLAALITLEHTGKPGDVITTGFVLDVEDGYSSGFAMWDSTVIVSRKLAGVHFRVGQPAASEGFPEGTYFKSPLLLADAGPEPAKVRVSVDYTIEGQDGQQSNTTANSFKHVLVKELTINPANVERIELSDEFKRLGITGPLEESGLEVTYDTAPGTVIGQLTSSDQSGNYSFEVPIKDPAAMNEQMEGDYPWTIEGDNRAVVHFKNTTQDPVTVLYILNFPDGAIYNPPPIVLRPFQSTPIDIQKLRQSKKRDVYGRLFPRNGTRGQVQWRQVIPYSIVGRLEETDLEHRIARSFSCGAGCCQYYHEDPHVSPSSFSGNAGDQTTLTGSIGGRDCNNNPFGGPANPGWSSNNSNVATVDANGNVTLVSAGSTTISAKFYLHDYFWNIDNRCHIEYYWQTVQVPITSRPTVSGPNTVWWFNGENPASSAYPTSVTLTSNGGSSTSWSVSQADAKVNLSSSTGAQITITATGTHFSSQNGDISITATVNGAKSAPFTMTAKTPWKLSFVSRQTFCNSSPQTYSTELTYDVIDNLSATMSTDINWNELVGTAACENGSNWCNYAIATSGGSTNPLTDLLAPPNLNVNPAPNPKPICNGQGSGTTPYRSIPQTIYVGNSNSGGVKAQGDTLGYYLDHGQHDSIQIPSQPPN